MSLAEAVGFSKTSGWNVRSPEWRLALFRNFDEHLTETQVKEELFRAGWEKDPPGPLTEYNRPVAGRTITRGGPVIYEGTFRRRGR